MQPPSARTANNPEHERTHRELIHDDRTAGRTAERIAECGRCPVGHAAGVTRGERCPLVDRRRPAATLVYLEGQRADRVWFIKRGAVLLSRESGAGGTEAVAWAVRRHGSFIGVECLNRKHYIDSAKALTDITLCSADATAFDAWLGPPGSPSRVVLQLVLDAQARDAPRRAGSDGTAVRRAAHWILRDAADAPRLPRRDIAQMLGMQPETLSRALATLAHRGGIALTRRELRVLDRAVLEEIAGGDDGV